MALMLGIGGQGKSGAQWEGGELERKLSSHQLSPFSGPYVEVSWANPLYTFVTAAAGLLLPFPRTVPSSLSQVSGVKSPFVPTTSQADLASHTDPLPQLSQMIPVGS